MKNVIIASGLVLILIFTAVISLTIFSRNPRQNEPEEALSRAVEQSLESLMVDKQYSIANAEEFVAEFTQRLVLGVDSKSTITVNVLAVDIEKGLLDVEVVERYPQPNGSTGEVRCRRTAILDVVYEEPVSFRTIQFLTQDGFASGDFKTYKVFTVANGSNVIFPGTSPTLSGRTFKGWSLEAPSEENKSPATTSAMVADKDLVFYAVFE